MKKDTKKPDKLKINYRTIELKDFIKILHKNYPGRPGLDVVKWMEKNGR